MISIVTINKNNLEGLKRTVTSVLNQQDKNFKWYILDGNSSDGSVKFIKEIEFNNLKVFIEEDEGIYHAMNKAINYVDSPDLVWFLNSGDSLVSNKIIQELNNLNFKGDVLYGNYFEVKYNDTSYKAIQRFSPSSVNLLWLYKKPLNHQSYMIRGGLLKKFPFDLSYKICADWVQFFNIYWKTPDLKIAYYPIFLVNYESGGYSSSNLLRYYEERTCFLNSFFSKRINEDFNQAASVFTKNEADKILRISKGKYSWMLLKFVLKFFK